MSDAERDEVRARLASTGRAAPFGAGLVSTELSRRVTVALVLAAFLGVVALLTWKSLRDPRVPLLRGRSGAEWITYPSPPSVNPRPRLELEASFRQSFTLEATPARATLSICLFRRGEARIGGKLVSLPDPGEDWKSPSTADVTSFLQSGTNEVEVRVRSEFGPPALWFALEVDGQRIASSSAWQASLAGAEDLPARSAATPMLFWNENDNDAFTGDIRSVNLNPPAATALAAQWTRLGVMAVLVAVVLLVGLKLGSRLSRRSASNAPSKRTRFLVRALPIALIALLFAALFWNNRALALDIGFDAPAHVEYVQHVLQNGRLPLANEGWEMYQPPLYYLMSAGFLWIQHALGMTGDVASLRILGWLALVLQCSFVLASLRLLFDTSPRRVWLGTCFAVCLPMQLYLYQYLSNEPWNAALSSASVYLGLRILVRGDLSLRSHVLLGLALGLAMLSKFSALIPLVVVTGVLALKMALHGQRSVAAWSRTIGACALTVLAVCGWHYARVWAHFGSPLVGNWELASGNAWWQDPGYRTSLDLVRFGQSLDQPLLSSMHSIPDALWSTLWGDGMLGGSTRIDVRPPWDFEAMSAGYLLALLPALALVVGGVAACAALFRRPRAEWLMLLGLLGGTGAAFLSLALELPFFAQSKAFYAAALAVPICALAGLGLDLLARCAGPLRGVVLVAFGAWAVHSFTTYWAPAGQSVQRLGSDSTQADRDAWLAEASALASQQRFPEAIELAKQAFDTAPDGRQAPLLLADLHEATGDVSAAIAVLRRALRFSPYSANLHFTLGARCASSGDVERALAHFDTCVRMAPTNADALFAVTDQMMAMGSPDAARHVLERSIEPLQQAGLADALAEVRRRLSALGGNG